MLERSLINGKEYLIYQIGSEVSLDRIGINMLENNSISGFMPFKYVREEERDYFRYDMITNITLEDWLGQIRYKSEVLAMINSVIAVYEEAAAYLLKGEQIFQNLSMISVLNGKCYFAYVLVNEVSCGNCLDLIQQILFKVKYPMDEVFGYLFDLQNAFSRGEIKTISDLKKWIRIVNGELKGSTSDYYVEECNSANNITPYQVNSISPRQVENKTTSMLGETESVQKPLEMKNKEEVINDIFSEFGIPVSNNPDMKQLRGNKKKAEKEKKESFKLFGKKNRTEKYDEPEMAISERTSDDRKDIDLQRNQVVINDLNRGNVTVLVNCDELDGAPVLIRDKNRQEYTILSSDSVIGSGKDADIVISENSSISRKHARLFVINGEYYIEDLDSTNGMCVNGEILTPHAPCLLKDMDHIKISNEIFTFRLRS